MLKKNNRNKVQKHVQQMLDKQFWRSEQTRHEKLVSPGENTENS